MKAPESRMKGCLVMWAIKVQADGVNIGGTSFIAVDDGQEYCDQSTKHEGQ